MDDQYPADQYPADRTRFREAMARLGAAVNIITTKGANGDSGFTASAVCSVTDDPPTILVCMNRSSSQYDIFKTSGHFCVNILAHDQDHLSPIFAGKLAMAERFTHGTWLRLRTGAPVLENATAALDCTVTQMVDVGTHTVIFGTAQAIYLSPSGSGLVYHGRAYHKLVTPAG